MTTQDKSEFMEMVEWVYNGEISSLSFYYDMQFFDFKAHPKGVKINRKLFKTIEEVENEYFCN